MGMGMGIGMDIGMGIGMGVGMGVGIRTGVGGRAFRTHARNGRTTRRLHGCKRRDSCMGLYSSGVYVFFSGLYLL